MKKVILGLIVVSLVACHSASTSVEVVSDSVLVKAVDSVATINDSLKVVDTLKK